jgi:hypothetical protein
MDLAETGRASDGDGRVNGGWGKKEHVPYHVTNPRQLKDAQTFVIDTAFVPHE